MIYKILHITANTTQGGGPEHIFKLIHSLQANGNCDNFVAGPTDSPYFERFQNIIGSNYFILPTRKFSFTRALKLALFILINNIDVIHTHGKGASLYGKFCKIFTRRILIHTPHGFHIGSYSRIVKFIYLAYEKFTSFLIDKIIFVSHGELEINLENNLNKFASATVIHNGTYCFESFLPSTNIRQELKILNSDFVLVTASRYDYQKNMDVFFDIASHLLNFKFIIIGDGPNLSYYKNKYGHFKNVYIIGNVVNPLDYYSCADLYLSTARWEGLPLAIIEAMSVGTPVIASNVVGNNEVVIDGRNGFLYADGNTHDAITYILKFNRLSSINKKQISEFCIKTQHDNFSIESMCRKTYSVYLDAINCNDLHKYI